ncbi:MAG TPA: acyl carrier protein [Ramlibacter sp.]|nr:acyl carrier protein [Ramlibacter sp.]
MNTLTDDVDLTMEQRIRDVLREYGRLNKNVDELDAGTDLYQSGMTSHASVNVMLGLESDFDVEFPDHMLKRSVFASIGAIRQALAQLVAS